MAVEYGLDSGRYRPGEAALRPPEPNEQLVADLSERLSATLAVVELADAGREFADHYEKARFTADKVVNMWHEAHYTPRPVDLFEGLVRFALADEDRQELAKWLFARVATDQGGVHGTMSHRYRLTNEIARRREEQAQQEARIREVLQ